MLEGDVNAIGLATSLILVAIALAVSMGQQLRLEKDLIWATARAFVQLIVMGFVLAWLLEPGRSTVFSWTWVAGMVVFAAWTVRNRAPEVPGLFPMAVAALAAATLATMGVIFGLGIFPMEARAIVPLGGMMIGNSLSGTVLAARRVTDELTEKRAEVEARLALGHSSRQAGRPYVRAAMRTALTPQIESTKAVGLVFLPGAMTGLILAGVDPVDAVLVQAVIMYLILGAVATTSVVVGLGSIRQLFTADHRLRRLSRRAD
ncbi:MAG: iron export ABC transporter permease subunit FetB [Acidimicrobiia bacterium]|nr:iron export ABC transporter permease subunit FetB [Acidimicrobiia bacterium]MDX2467961.1 iron export ABC transporter permease subunit FetB [Acidimicrobiia bacterium]